MENRKQQRTTVQVIIISSFMSAFMGTSLNVAIPDMGVYFHAGAGAVGWIITIFALATSAFGVTFGKIADTTGRRRIFILGILLFSLASFLCAFAWDLTSILAFRALQGIAASMLFATNTAIIVSVFPGKERGKAIGKMIAGTYVGLSSGPVLGGLLNQWLGWQSIFILCGAIGVYSLAVSIARLPKSEEPLQENSRDILGNLLFIAMIILFMYGFSSFGSNSLAWAFLTSGIIAGVLFVVTELKAVNPVIDVRIFKNNPAYTLSNIAALFNYSATFAIGYFMSLYLQLGLGYSSQTAGLILIAQPAVMALVTPFTGRMSDRIAPYKLATTGMFICTACLAFFAAVDLNTPVWAIFAALLVTGLGIAIFSSPNMNAIMSCVDRSRYGVASSILATMRTLGQTTGIAAITIIIGVYAGNASLAATSPHTLVQIMHTGFIIFAAVCFIGAMMSLKRKGTGNNQ